VRERKIFLSFAVLIVALIFLGISANAIAAIVKWSQLPSMEPMDGYSFSSETQVPSSVADDFLCKDGRPVIGLTWWGSYWNPTRGGVSYYPYPNSDTWGDPVPNPPGTVTGFVVTFWSDIPTGQGIPPWSHPGTVVYGETIPFSQVKETIYGTITRGSSVETVFQYDAALPSPFEQELGKIYWLSIQALDPNGDPIQWGWHESTDLWNDNAVQTGYSPYGWWDFLPGEDMAFEIKVVPIPTTLLLLGTGLLGILGLKRRSRLG